MREAIDASLWQAIFSFSERTFLRHGNGHYLNVEFLRQVSAAQPGTVVVKLAERAGTPVAAAIFFEGGGWLYGRYWGATHEVPFLHFNVCFYFGIEECIRRGLSKFEPVVVKDHAPTAHQAIQGAVAKLKRAVATSLEKHDTRRAPAPELPSDTDEA